MENRGISEGGLSEGDSLFGLPDHPDLWSSVRSRVRLASERAHQRIRHATRSVSSMASGFNHTVGFTKLPPTAQQPLRRRKIYVVVFEAIGLISGVLFFISALAIQRCGTFKAIADQNDNYDLDVEQLRRYTV